MQFSIVASVLAVAAMASAQYNGTAPIATGTGVAAPSGTGSMTPSGSTVPFDNGATSAGASLLGLAVAGGVALMI